MRRRAPESLAGILSDAVGEVEPDSLLARVQRLWPEVAGAMNAAHTSAARERAGVVWIECDASVFAHELELMGPDLRAALNARLKGLEVRELRFSVKTP